MIKVFSDKSNFEFQFPSIVNLNKVFEVEDENIHSRIKRYLLEKNYIGRNLVSTTNRTSNFTIICEKGIIKKQITGTPNDPNYSHPEPGIKLEFNLLPEIIGKAEDFYLAGERLKKIGDLLDMFEITNLDQILQKEALIFYMSKTDMKKLNMKKPNLQKTREGSLERLAEQENSKILLPFGIGPLGSDFLKIRDNLISYKINN